MPNSDEIFVGAPSDDDLPAYYQLRFDVLRKPWGQPPGSEKDETDGSSIHGIAKLRGCVVAVGRLHFPDAEKGQVRYMAVHPLHPGKGYGRLVLQYLEKECVLQGRGTIILHARENAIGFYEKCGYRMVEKSYLLWGQIQHWLMEKEISSV